MQEAQEQVNRLVSTLNQIVSSGRHFCPICAQNIHTVHKKNGNPICSCGWCDVVEKCLTKEEVKVLKRIQIMDNILKK